MLTPAEITARLGKLRGSVDVEPNASVIIPVNAQGDLDNVRRIIDDIARYEGRNTLELILVVNNYPPDRPPESIEVFRELGIRVVSIPSVRKPGEAVGFTARIPGVRAARSEACLLFDADCRIPDPTSLFDWYVEQFDAGAHAAYTHVGYYELTGKVSVRARIAVHHLSRWFKRAVLRIPTTRGSNYAVRRETMIRLYDAGMLADEMNVGPTMKARAGRVAYSGARNLLVLTSGRMFSGGWVKLARYLIYRLKYNLRVLPVRAGVAGRTGRENDPIRRYVNNRPVTRDVSGAEHAHDAGSMAQHSR